MTSMQLRPEGQTPTNEEISAERKKYPIGVVPAHLQAMIDERKAINEMTRQIAGMTWSKDLDQNVARSIAEYCRRKDIDPTTELEVLGGRLYRNAYFYRRKVAGLVACGIVTSIDAPDHVAADPRLTELAKSGGEEAEWARKESARRLRHRIEHGAPEAALAVVVQRLRVAGLEEPVVGCNWAGGGSRKGDPVGETNATLTAETRAFRRAALKLADVMPSLRAELGEEDDDGVAVEEAIKQTKVRIRAERAEHQEKLPSRGHALTVPEPPPRLTDEQLEANARAMDRTREQVAENQRLLDEGPSREPGDDPDFYEEIGNT